MVLQQAIGKHSYHLLLRATSLLVFLFSALTFCFLWNHLYRLFGFS
ncbi:hypothetical protein RV03_GL002654 [Enterococcus gallinarum]|nr:hypothetical protein RV03_GL002654 [Enterococcus gallinarum]